MRLSNDRYGLNEAEFDKIFCQWNKPNTSYPSDKTINQLFEEQVKKTPNSIALVYMSQVLTYKELNQRANQLARYLRKEYRNKTSTPLTANTLIALRLDKSLEMVVAVLAVLKAGGAYVPIDPSYPPDRLAYILDDTKAQIVLTQQHFAKALPATTQVQYIVTDLDSDIYNTVDGDNLKEYATAQDLAYVIYTSGTTGKPKGVMIPHKGIVNRLTWMQSEYPLSAQDVVLQKTAYVFDVSVWELFWAHWYGAKLVMCEPEGHKDSSYLYRLINDQNVTKLHFVPSMLDAYNSYLMANHLTLNPCINTLFCSGEALQPITMEQTYHNAVNKQFKLHNLYGPTEASIDVTYFETFAGHDICIGKPIANTKAYILDESRRPVPINTIGELYIGGAGLALGYLNRAQLTEERFIPNDFATEDDIRNGYTKLYKTGDLTRWTADGNISYLGRKDDQVKIRGYRIELGEIECTLRDIEAIELACVLAKTRETDIGTSKYLVGYYKVMPGHSTTQAHIVSELSKALPEYMVPNALVEMAEFPLTVNGKLDKKSLPEAHFTATENYVAPRNDLDNRLCTLWQSVLCIERVGITDNFFRLGGDSILAIVLSAKMSQLLDYEIKVADIFKFTSIETILADCPKKKKISIPKLEQNTSALSFAQDRLWFIEKYEEGTSAYHIPCLYQLSPDANISWVKQAIQAVVARHDILRTTIEQTDLDDIQVIHREPVSIAEKQVNDGSNYRDILSEDINAPFDLRSHYPIKVTLYQLQDDSFSYLLLINFHHIAADGWSVDIFERDFMSYYDVYASQRGRNLAELPIQYVDYAEWQRKHLQGDAYQEQVNYWKHKLAGSPTLECPTDFPRPNNVSYAGKHECFSIDLETSQALRALAKQANCTLHTVTLSLFSLLLSKYCHQTDIVTGTPIANRHLVQTQDLIGLFINTQVNRVHINASETFKELIQRVQQDQVDAQRHQDIPFEQLMKELKVERDISRHPIFQIMFGVQGFGHVEEQGKNNKGNPLIPYSGLTDIYEYARFDMEFFIDDRQEALQGIIRYAHKLFKAETILAIISRYKYLIEQVVSIADVKVHTLSILRDEELKKLTHDWNQTDRAFPTHKTIHQLFEEQVVKTPHSTAILSAETRLSYRALNIRANQLARQIRHLYQQRTGDELAPNTLIALYLDRSIEMIVAVLAVLKAGAAYVPIDPSYPTERCRFMIEDTQAELVLTLKNTLLNEYAASEERLSQPICARDKWVTIDLDEPFYRQIDSSNLEPYSNSEHLAYVIYTSGTTGKPKGTMLPHRGIVNRITWMQATYPLSGSDVVLQKTPYVFDVSVWELFWAHWYGATLVQAKPDGHKDSDYLNKLIVKESVTTLHFVPSMLEAYNGFLTSSNDKLPNTIKQMFCSGEALHETTVNTTYHLAQSPEFKLHNLYGPTEASIDVTYFETTAGKAVSIGKPINNTRVYVLDENQQPVPVGVVGELYLGGAGLAYGYLNRQALTAARFVDNTFATESDRQKGYLTLYKTGDLVRWLPDGNIDYIGRNDDQVKIRGHRVELDEIASKLRSVDGIKQACVMVKQRVISNSVTQYLVAYYTETRKNSVNDELILDKLANDLPDYMLPSVFVKMDAFPLTINGKLDRRSLPEPTLNHDKNFKAPRGQLETALCHIWQEVVGLQQVGITDNFFRIGGDSILAIRAVYLSAQTGYQFSVANIFLYPTIEKLAEFLRKNQNAHPPCRHQKTYQPFDLVDRTQLSDEDLSHFEDVYPVSYTQLGIISENLKHEHLVHTDNFHFKVFHPYSHTKLLASLNVLLKRHELLHSIIHDHPTYDFLIGEKKDYQVEDYVVVHTLISEDYEAFDGEAFGHEKFSIDDVINDMGQTLFQLHVIINEEDTSNFTLVGLFNHVIADGWSLNLFSSQLMNMYLYDKEPSFVDSMKYAEFIANEQECVARDNSREFWLDHLKDYEPKPHLELRNTIEANSIEVDALLVQVDPTFIENAHKLCEKLHINIDIIFMAATYVLMSRFYTSDDITLGYIQNNRPETIGSENTFGYFLNPIPLRINGQHNDPIELLEKINQIRSQVLNHKLYPYPLIQKELGANGTLFNMAFNYISFKGIDAFSGKDIDTYINTGLEDVPAYVEVRDINGEFYIQLNFKEGSVDAYYQKYLTEYYLFYLASILSEKPIKNLMLEDHKKIVSTWNQTEATYPKDKNLQLLFEDQVKKTPQSIALVFENEKLTYHELNVRANKLAHTIRAQYRDEYGTDLQPDTLIALYLDRGLEMVISILAVLKSGGAYVPISPEYPKNRTTYILADINATLLLTQQHHLERLDGWASELDNSLVFISIDHRDFSSLQTSDNPEPVSSATDLAYVIYTSGTTGKPKGVMVEQAAVTSFVINNNYLDAKDVNVVASLSSHVFDGFIFDLFFSLLNGKSVVLLKKEDVLELPALVRKLSYHHVDSLFVTTALFNSLMVNGDLKTTSLRNILFGGEASNIKQVADIIRKYPELSFTHVYGPTECVVFATACRLSSMSAAVLPIGKALPGKSLYILSSLNKPVPIGVPGELYIGGAGLARGYYNNPALTSERFIDNPFATQSDIEKGDTRLYKTGDLVRWLPDGNVEYLARNDFQVKINGYRIELGEIESALTALPDVKQAAVIEREHQGQKYLAAYLMQQGGASFQAEVFRNALKETLPEYMVPATFTQMTELPLSINGKLDRHALPEPKFVAVDNYVAPRDEHEKDICVIWQDVLGLQRVGINDDFFKIGGESISAIRLSHRVTAELGYQVSVANIFSYPTILSLLENIDFNKQSTTYGEL